APSPRPRAGAAPVPRFAPRRVPLPRAGRAGDEPPGGRRADGRARRVADRSWVAAGTVRRPDRPTEFHAMAPVRLDFAGGWTDVPPFSAREGGVVVNAAIGLYAHAEVCPGGTGLHLVAEDLEATLDLPDEAALSPRGPLALLQAGL